MNNRLKLWIAIVVVFLILFASSFYWFVRSIENNFDERHQPRIETALKKTALHKVTDVYSYISDRTYTVVLGTDRNRQKMVVWVGWQFLRSAYLTDGITANEIKQQFMGIKPEAKPTRIRLGIYDKQPSWEVYYERISTNQEDVRRGYQYFRFEDGVDLGFIELPK